MWSAISGFAAAVGGRWSLAVPAGLTPLAVALGLATTRETVRRTCAKRR